MRVLGDGRTTGTQVDGVTHARALLGASKAPKTTERPERGACRMRKAANASWQSRQADACAVKRWKAGSEKAAVVSHPSAAQSGRWRAGLTATRRKGKKNHVVRNSSDYAPLTAGWRPRVFPAEGPTLLTFERALAGPRLCCFGRGYEGHGVFLETLLVGNATSREQGQRQRV
jgi:hypothetical protein